MASRSAKKSMKEKKGSENLYNAKGSPEAAAVEKDTDSMKKGGRAKKAGGKVEGEKQKARADKKSRGPHKRAAGGRTPFTSGHNTTSPSESGKTESGHEGQRPSIG